MSDTSTATATEAAIPAVPEKYRLALKVDVQKVGPCKRHVRVTIPQADIDHFRAAAVKEVSSTAAVPGFRVGFAPAKLVERRFRKELSDQVRQKLLMDSLEQLSEDKSLDPINQPDFDFETLDVPDTGDFEYEFDVEVRPEFELPNYAGLKIQRSVKTVTDADVDAYLQKFLAEYGHFHKVDRAAQPGDFLMVDFDFSHDAKALRHWGDTRVELKPVLRFQDGELHGFAELMTGAVPGDVRSSQLAISSEAETVELRGETVSIAVKVREVQELHRPDLTDEYVNTLGFDSVSALRDEIRNMLDRQTTFAQRQETRKQVLSKITESASWDLPEEMVSKQVENALRREILEMEQAGFTWSEIRTRENEIRQRSITTTRQALKEHFMLDKIATQENLDVTSPEIESEIYMMALQRGENPRRVRSRLIKGGMIDNLEAQIRERKAVDHILSKVQFEDVPLQQSTQDDVVALGLAICGLSSVTASPADAAAAADEE